MKYKNLEELAHAFQSGQLNDWILRVDNDSCYLMWNGDYPNNLSDDEMDELYEEKYCEGVQLFSKQIPIDVVEVLNMCGIPAEYV